MHSLHKGTSVSSLENVIKNGKYAPALDSVWDGEREKENTSSYILPWKKISLSLVSWYFHSVVVGAQCALKLSSHFKPLSTLRKKFEFVKWLVEINWMFRNQINWCFSWSFEIKILSSFMLVIREWKWSDIVGVFEKFLCYDYAIISRLVERWHD